MVDARRARKGPATLLVALVLAGALLGMGAPSARSAADAVPLRVRYPEGMLHGFLVLKDAGGAVIAQGDQLQLPRKGRIESRMVFRFTDGSLLDERVTFSQDSVFRLHDYRLIQRGPAFEEDAEAWFERSTRAYRVRYRDRDDGEVEVIEGDLDEFPDDIANGMVIVLAKNLAPDRAGRFHFVAFAPGPKIIELELEPSGNGQATFGRESKNTVRYVIKAKLGFLLGLGAKLTGKTPPDRHAWLLTEHVPAFVKFVGPLSLSGMGPAWQVELTAPTWAR